MYKLLILSLLALISSCCNITVNLIHTEGQATDLVDETDSASPNVDTKVTVPLSGL